METLWQDLRYAARSLMKKPGYALVIVLTLALGIGSVAAVFSFFDAVLLRPLAYQQSERLVQFQSTESEKTGAYSSHPDFVDLRDQSRSFERVAAVRSGGWTLTGDGDAERLPGARVSAEFFPMLGVKPALGRVFRPEEDRPGAERVVMLHHNAWQRRFGGDPGIVGRTLTLNGYGYMVIGVLPQDFHFFPIEISIAEIYGTLAYESSLLNERQTRRLAIFGKLRPGVTLAQAQSEMSGVARRLSEQFPQTNANRGVKLVSLQEQVVGSVRGSLVTLLGAVGFVLLIACANVAALQFARATLRRKEIVIRSALGASRWRVMRQLLTESLLLTSVGGAAGLLLAYWTVKAIVALNPKGLPRLDEVSVDSRAILFTGGVALAASAICGLIPARQSSRLDLNQSLREDSYSATAGAHRSALRQTLVIAEVVLAFVLLVGAGLLGRSFARMMQIDLGFRPENVLKLTVVLPAMQYKDDQQKAAFIDLALEHIRALPGLESAAAANVTPLSGYQSPLNFDIEGRPPALPGLQPSAEYRAVSHDYFRTMGISLRRGRPFTEQDVKQQPQAGGVAIINESLVRRYFTDEDPLGKRLALAKDSAEWREIIGVAGDVKHNGVIDEATPEIYAPTLRNASGAYDLVVRSATGPAQIAAAVRGQFRALDPNLPLFTIRTLEETVALNLARQRFAVALLSAFATVGLLLAAVGVYGVMAYSVSQRTREMGVRMALGAQSSDVLRMVLLEGFKLTAIGAAIGLPAALAITRLMKNLLYGVSASDPLTFAGVPVLLAVVALLACWLPARRAAKTDPIGALRGE
jgi:putative ABC transport system permease protein